MAKTFTYKKQGDGRDSWRCEDDATNEVYMVYEDPFAEKKIDISNIDIDTLSDDAIKKLLTRINNIKT